MKDDPELRRLLWFLLGGTRGGETRARILAELKERPGNINQIATRLGLHYRAVQHHIAVLTRNSLVVSKGEHYGLMYFMSAWLESNTEVFYEIAKKLKIELAERT